MTHGCVVFVWMFQCLVCSVVNLSSWEPETACDLPKTKQRRCCHRSPELTTSSPNLGFRPTLTDIGDTPMHIDLIHAKLAVALSPHLAAAMQLQLISWLFSLGLPPRRSLIYRTRKRRLEGEHMGPVQCATIVRVFRQHCPGQCGLPAALWCWLHCPSQFCLANNIIIRKHCPDHSIRTRTTPYIFMKVTDGDGW